MLKIQNIEKLTDFLDDEIGWRKKEITFLCTSAERDQDINRNTLIRAGIALVYAHWEGFVKNASIGYLSFVKMKKLRYKDLKPNFMTLKFFKGLKECAKSEQLSSYYTFVTRLYEAQEQNADFDEMQIDTKSNLSSKVLKDILNTIGLQTSFFETKTPLIDEQLVAYRNSIAHGDRRIFKFEDLKTLAEEVLNMLEQYKLEIIKAAENSDFKKIPN